jgi:uncharacterized membrane protein YvbJ
MRARNMCPICRRPITIRATPPTAIVVELEEDDSIQIKSMVCMMTCIFIVIVITLVFILGKY